MVDIRIWYVYRLKCYLNHKIASTLNVHNKNNVFWLYKWNLERTNYNISSKKVNHNIPMALISIKLSAFQITHAVNKEIFYRNYNIFFLLREKMIWPLTIFNVIALFTNIIFHLKKSYIMFSKIELLVHRKYPRYLQFIYLWFNLFSVPILIE